MNIYLSAGHRGGGTGANTRNGREAELTIMFRNKLYRLLLPRLSGAHRIMLDKDTEEESKVIRHINNFCGKKGVAIEFHFDASSNESASGSSVFIADEASVKSRHIAEDLAPLISDIAGVKNRGVRTEKQTAHKIIGFLRQTKCPSVLIELCFLSNDSDMAKFNSSVDRLAGAMCEYILSMVKGNV